MLDERGVLRITKEMLGWVTWRMEEVLRGFDRQRASWDLLVHNGHGSMLVVHYTHQRLSEAQFSDIVPVGIALRVVAQPPEAREAILATYALAGLDAVHGFLSQSRGHDWRTP